MTDSLREQEQTEPEAVQLQIMQLQISAQKAVSLLFNFFDSCPPHPTPVYCVFFVNAHSLLLLISSYLFLLSQLGVFFSLPASLPESHTISLHCLLSLPLFLFSIVKDAVDFQIKAFRPVKTASWSHLASLQVIMKCTDMLICTKPSLLMKTQYWLPFIRLIMKYQYHLPSYRASVNRASNECVSLQTHLDPVTYISLEIAPDGCRKLIGLSFDGRFFLGQVKKKKAWT